jgi:TonB-dependent starch-binding outer membrane protein SusC
MKKLQPAHSLFAIFLFCSVFSFAQNTSFRVSGVVKDEKGQALPGVTVAVKGSTSGTATDASGKFSIEVPSSGSTLIFTSVGYEPTEVKASKSNFDVTLSL